MQLTPTQAFRIEQAQKALAASKASPSTENYPMHLGACEYHVEQLIELISELTGAQA